MNQINVTRNFTNMRMLFLFISFFAFSLTSQKVSGAACNDTSAALSFSKAEICSGNQAYEEVLLSNTSNLSNNNLGRCRILSEVTPSEFIFSDLKYKGATDKNSPLPSYHFSKSIGLRLIFPKHYFW